MSFLARACTVIVIRFTGEESLSYIFLNILENNVTCDGYDKDYCFGTRVPKIIFKDQLTCFTFF